MEIYADSPALGWYRALQLVRQGGEPVSPRVTATIEVRHVTLFIDRPWLVPFDIPGRGLNPFIGAVEAAQLVGQTSEPEVVWSGTKAMHKFTDHGVYHGAYGIRLHGQLGPLVEKLEDDKATRQAVLTVYSSGRDLGADVRDVPCTLSLQFVIRNGALELRTSMRSNDVWLGLPYDLVQFAALQGAVAKALDIPMGEYVHTVGSLHLYADDWAKADEVQPIVSTASGRSSNGYRPMWSGKDIGEISSIARKILLGIHRPYANPAPFETWLAETIMEEPSEG